MIKSSWNNPDENINICCVLFLVVLYYTYKGESHRSGSTHNYDRFYLIRGMPSLLRIVAAISFFPCKSDKSNWQGRQRGEGKIRIGWLYCPVCGNKTRKRIREDTVLKNYPLYCPKCKRETLVEVMNLVVMPIKSFVKN